MKKVLPIVMLLLLLGTASNAQKLAKQMGEMACECYNDKAKDLIRKRDPEALAKACIQSAVEKNIKKLSALMEKDKPAFEEIMISTSTYIVECGGFKYLEDKNAALKEDISKAKTPKDTTLCAGMREGVFLYISDDMDDYYVERRDSVQFEYWGATDMIETRVIWDGACKYHTAHVRTNSDAVRKQLTPGQGVIVAITEVNGDEYTVLVEGPDGTQSTIKYKKMANREFKFIGKQ